MSQSHSPVLSALVFIISKLCVEINKKWTALFSPYAEPSLALLIDCLFAAFGIIAHVVNKAGRLGQ